MIVGLCGYAGCGKDTAAEHMPGWRRAAFADELKKDLREVLAEVGVDVERMDRETKEKVRPLFVAWGVVARSFDQRHWINRLMKTIPQDKDVVITDVRYIDEVDAIILAGGLVLHIIRPENRPANQEEELSIGRIDRVCRLPKILNDSTPEALGQAVLAHISEWRKKL